MKVDGISVTNRIYSIPVYNKMEKVPPVEKIEGGIENSSRNIRDLEIFKFYAKQGLQNFYSKGQIFSIIA